MPISVLSTGGLASGMRLGPGALHLRATGLYKSQIGLTNQRHGVRSRRSGEPTRLDIPPSSGSKAELATAVDAIPNQAGLANGKFGSGKGALIARCTVASLPLFQFRCGVLAGKTTTVPGPASNSSPPISTVIVPLMT